MGYRLYIFLTSYRAMRDVYGKDLDILSENISSYIKTELENLSGRAEETDNRSILIKSTVSDDFKTTYSLAVECAGIITRVRSLLKDLKTNVPVKIGIITDEETGKKHPFRSNLPSDETDSIPDILLSDKTSVSIIENYEIQACGLRNIWTTNGIEINRIKKIRNIYFNRDEEDALEEFLNGPFGGILYIWGEKGSGKSGIIREVLQRNEFQGLVHLNERKHSTREFKLVHELIYYLLFTKRHGGPDTIEDVIRRIDNSILPPMNRSNLIYFVSLLFSENEQEKAILFDYGTYRTSLKKALLDCLKLNAYPFTVLIDDHQWVSRNCENIIMEMFSNAKDRIRLVFCSDDRNNFSNPDHPVKYLHIGDLNKVQVSKMLKMLFPRMKVEGKAADFIHRATGGNLYTVIEFIQYLTDKDCISINDGKVIINYPDIKNIPDNLNDMFFEKAASLSKNASDILKIISIIGEEFYPSDLDWLLHILNYSGDENIALRELEERGIIENAGDHFSVAEVSVISEIYKGVKESNRKLIHRLLGELFETKGFEKFGFKVFLHYLKAENYEKLIELLPQILSRAHSAIQFNALKNILEIADKLLFRLCMKENAYPAEIWLNNLKLTKYLFDKDNPLDTVKRFEKAIDHLIKSEKTELTLDLFPILLKCYISSGRSKKSSQYIKAGLELADKHGSLHHKHEISVLDIILRLNSKDEAGTVRQFDALTEEVGSGKDILDSEEYKYLKARVSFMKNDTDTAHGIFRELLDFFVSTLNFTYAEEVTMMMVEISMRKRDHRSAEEYCKYILASEKESPSNAERIIRTNILLARLYGYQNKFLQAVSLLESLNDRTRKPELKDEILYELGSVYQFYDEKDLAVKTFEKTAEKKNKKSGSREHSSKFIIKSALVLASMEKYDEALEKLVQCGGKEKDICVLIRSVIDYIVKKDNDASAAGIIKKLGEMIKGKSDLVFESALLLLSNLIKRRKTELCAELNEMLSGLSNDVDDYNLVLEFNKTSRMLHKIGSKSKKTPSEIKKIVPSARRRVRTRRNV